MRISEAAAQSGLGVDTIRYYEKEGLLGTIARGQDGHRVFSAENLRWLQLFEKLRATRMPLVDMKRYAALAHQGDATLVARRDMLRAHRDRLDQQEARIQACRALIDQKISTYEALAGARLPATRG